MRPPQEPSLSAGLTGMVLADGLGTTTAVWKTCGSGTACGVKTLRAALVGNDDPAFALGAALQMGTMSANAGMAAVTLSMSMVASVDEGGGVTVPVPSESPPHETINTVLAIPIAGSVQIHVFLLFFMMFQSKKAQFI